VTEKRSGELVAEGSQYCLTITKKHYINLEKLKAKSKKWGDKLMVLL